MIKDSEIDKYDNVVVLHGTRINLFLNGPFFFFLGNHLRAVKPTLMGLIINLIWIGPTCLQTNETSHFRHSGGLVGDF